MIDIVKLRDQLSDALTAAPEAEDASIRVESDTRTRVSANREGLCNLQQESDLGGCVRVLVNGRWGFTSFNDLDDLKAKVREAVRIAQLLGPGTVRLAEKPVVDQIVRSCIETSPRQIPIHEKVKAIQGYTGQIVKGDPRVANADVSYGDFHYQRVYADRQGSWIAQEKMRVQTYLMAMVADTEGRMQIGGETAYSLTDAKIFYGLESKCDAAVKKAIEIAGAPVVPAGVYPVVVDPDLCGVFIHEAFGHLSEADHIYENPRWQELLPMGRPMGETFLNVVDSAVGPICEGGAFSYDDEGVRTHQTYLIKQGVLNSRLHSRETAAALSEDPTGNARALSYRYAPIVRMTNTYIEAGPHSREDMFKDVKLGIYAVGAHGGQTNGELFQFGAEEGFLIRDGQIAERVRNVALAGNLF
ncbi:MAG: TldD/PmbA family protein, partial [bacterium]